MQVQNTYVHKWPVVKDDNIKNTAHNFITVSI